MTALRTRFAPSPTGSLHLGNVWAAVWPWALARASKGAFLLRLDDLDRARCPPAFAADVLADLDYLGLGWDGPVVYQSQRTEAYRAAFEALLAQRRVYACGCSRAEVARAVSAPHVGDEGPRYPGTCRDRAKPPSLPRCWRFDTRGFAAVRLQDDLQGVLEQDVEREVGDFPVWSGQGAASYQLAVAVDDAAAGVTHVVRGRDLLASTPRQCLVYDALGLSRPSWAHLGLVVDATGARLAKRAGAQTVKSLREQGVARERIYGALARAAGLTRDEVFPLEAWVDVARGSLRCAAGDIRPGEVPLEAAG